LLFTAACGREDARFAGGDSPASGEAVAFDKADFDRNFIPQLGLSSTEGTVVVKVDTLLKTEPAQGGSLRPAQKCALPAGTVLTYTAAGAQTAGHRLLTLAAAPAGCILKSGYVFEGHVSFETRKVWLALPTAATRFKARIADSSKLGQGEWCALQPGIRYRLASQPIASASGHAKVTFAKGELPGCALQTGYLYEAHFQDLLEASPDQEFPRVMKHILLWEGGCSDDPDDRGGRTFKGITTERARLNGFTRDVCTMSHTMVLDIYREDYWKNRAAKYGWPMNLAIMNTEVNSGGRRAQTFLDRMAARQIQGTLQQKASWFVDQQSDFYRTIVANNSSQRKFLRGWLNRSEHIQDVISGQISLHGNAEAPAWTAKALD